MLLNGKEIAILDKRDFLRNFLSTLLLLHVHLMQPQDS